MADNDLQAELDSLFGNTSSDAQKPAPTEVPPADVPQPKPMLGKGAAKPLGKGFTKGAGLKKAIGAPAAQPAAPAQPTAAPAPKQTTAPAVPPMAPAIPPVMPARIPAPAGSSPAGKISLVVSVLCLLFIFVSIIMINKVNARLDALTTAVEKLSQVQQQQTKEIDHLQKTQIKVAQRLHETLVDEKKSDLQKNVRMTLEAVEMLQQGRK